VTTKETDTTQQFPLEDAFFRMETAFLKEVLELCDSHVQDIEKWDRDNEGDGYYQKVICCEVGLGFAACQQYITSVHSFWGIEKKTALQLGPHFKDKLTIAWVIDTAANCWKHQAEWLGRDKFESPAKHTRDCIRQLSVSPDEEDASYQILRLVKNDNGTASLIPDLQAWAKEVQAESIRTEAWLNQGWFKAYRDKALPKM